ncbi:MAG TPA: sugar phosphate nucleotidyltransferase [Rhizomicrobium sp.]|nr:sugar phosphate nucleotidyltransferase [Rhizomicrobium sp.]
MSRRAVILAGGRGMRLRPYTVVLPKPLMPIGDFPILEVIVRQLKNRGFDHITLAVNHQAELIVAFFGDGTKWGLKIDYSREDRPLSTMGPLQLIPDLPENFLVMNGDTLTDLDYATFLDAHCADGNIFTISSFVREHRVDYGVLEPDTSRRLGGFREKPVLTYEVSMGVYAVSRAAAAMIPAGRAYGFDNLMLDMIAGKTPAHIVRHEGYWLDIGRPDDYAQAIEDFDKMSARLLHV